MHCWEGMCWLRQWREGEKLSSVPREPIKHDCGCQALMSPLSSMFSSTETVTSPPSYPHSNPKSTTGYSKQHTRARQTAKTILQTFWFTLSKSTTCEQDGTNPRQSLSVHNQKGNTGGEIRACSSLLLRMQECQRQKYRDEHLSFLHSNLSIQNNTVTTTPIHKTKRHTKLCWHSHA